MSNGHFFGEDGLIYPTIGRRRDREDAILGFPAVSLPFPRPLIPIGRDPIQPAEVLDAIEHMDYGQRLRLAELLGAPRPRHEFLFLPRTDGGYLEPIHGPSNP